VNGELSHGLSPLRAAGNRIIDVLTGEPVTLRGINRSGMEYSEPAIGGFLASASLSRTDIEQMVCGWGANVIRLPFNQDWALRGRGNFSAEDYRQALDEVISWAASFGAYTLLDLQWLDADAAFGRLSDGSVNRVAPLPNQASIELWAALAERYRDEPAVLFDLFNEPHAPLKDDQNPMYFLTEDGAIELSEPRTFGPSEWNRWASKLATAIQDIHPRALVWVSGLDWGFDLREVHIDLPNVVYSAHVYPNRPRRQWKSKFGHGCSGNPVFIGEWGGSGGDLAWGSELISYMRTVACGWTTWSWVDQPRLVHDARAGDYTPTAFGSLVRSELASGGGLLVRQEVVHRGSNQE
jgi:endoglucanase